MTKAEYDRAWWAAHPDYRRQWRAKHRDEINARKREAWRTNAALRERERERKVAYLATPENKAKVAESGKVWRAKNVARRKEYCARWYAANRESELAKAIPRSAEYRRANPERALATVKRWCEANPERLKAIKTAYCLEHPEVWGRGGKKRKSLIDAQSDGTLNLQVIAKMWMAASERGT